MHVLEAVVSFLVLVSILPIFFSVSDSGIDTTYYDYKLAGDVIRVLTIHGSLYDINERDSDFSYIEDITGWCVSDSDSCDENKFKTVFEVPVVDMFPRKINITVSR
ncbi:hypothetical protein JXB01_03035 [Candidatus Micrarchaeota archaeon]|nr:hypothetical protein [Candidatus Micrarchaeota archaeon]